MINNPRHIPATKKEINSKTSETTEKFREIMKYLLGYTNLKPTKKVENFVGQFFEKFFEKLFSGSIVDINWHIPDIEVKIWGKKILFEIKTSNNWNWINLKLNQLKRFVKHENCMYIFVFYKCDKPAFTYQQLWYEWFLEKIAFDSIYVIPPFFLSEFESQNEQLKRRQKLTFMDKPRDETVIKVSRSRLEEFCLNNNIELQIKGKIRYYWIKEKYIKPLLDIELP